MTTLGIVRKNMNEWPTDKKLILLPGLDGTGLLFKDLITELPTNCIIQTICYPSSQVQTFEEHVQYVLGRLPNNEPFTLLAESFSGPVAIEVLKARNHQIEKVIFVASFAKSPRPLLLRLASRLPFSTLLKWHIPKFLIRYFCLGKNASSELIRHFRKTITVIDPKVLAQRIKIISDIDKTKELQNIIIPCCYIQATHDRLVHSSALKVFQYGLKSLTVKKIQGPHFILQAAPKEVAKVICTEIL
ncbi:alpha/beta fold hydrolase [Zooshikella harenae]|uniref:Alpha/beta hydrolase n=1 Tax=Zooshikella harenae TaxID=2827238 RepID=A0ABS5ZAI8_9GAMM|nr:alpha/beta hydrolase [Zooshikella harenae]MBU2710995.1 alpha/beta hydrolase [Zooshikella harenae]